ncbi:MAG: pyrroloquinoline quinone-dependent dehydrogenase [Acidobacteria bacterium]|nr:MAG: pyrroloquinoline quinone-dependent dehydrogenase [Acidobacteriota bacterium]
MRGRRIRPQATITASALMIGIAAVRLATVAGGPADGWPSYGHDPGGMRFSPLTEIDRTNVARLEVAWTVHTGDISDGSGGRSRSGFETTPIVVDEVLYFSTPFNRVIALDPETGKERWSYDPKIDKTTSYGDGLINRGVSTWLDAARRTNEPCRRRIYEATLDARLIALDARTGAPCADFGRGGQVDLTGVAAYRKGEYHMTSPPAVVDDVVIVGSAIDDNGRVDMSDGVVRAFDARTGAPRWRWDPISRTAAAKTGAANAWSIMSVDAERHLVFVPTGSASPDYYGGLRPGDNRWASSVVALRAKTGEVAWGFQLVHHDLWDYDTAAPPLVATVHRDGRDVPVVIQGNKTGFVYVLNRDTGAPVFPVEERRVPASDVDGERASATQPFPVDLPPLAPQSFSADAAWGATDADRDACRDAVRSLRNDGIFTPPSVRGTLAMPGNLGGLTWSGYAYDPGRGLLIANVNNLPARVQLFARATFDSMARTGNGEYAPQAGSPFGMFRRFLQAPSGLPCGMPPWGSLVALDLTAKRIRWQVPLGSMQRFGADHAGSIPPGSVGLGGPIVTAGGLVFIAGAVDSYLRAFDVETGRELWKGQLPASGHATPMTYRIGPAGRQYVVVAAGGHAKITEEKLSDALVAFALRN